jgi:hypothetical protein
MALYLLSLFVRLYSYIYILALLYLAYACANLILVISLLWFSLAHSCYI